MVTVDEFSRLVCGIYAAATAPEHWQSAIRDIHQTIGGTAGSLCVADGAIWSIEDCALPDDAAKSYAEYYCHIDPVLAKVKSGPVGAVWSGTELIAPYRKSEYYAGWLRPNQLEDGLCVRLTAGERPACFIVDAPRRSDPFDTAERVKLMHGLIPHLQQALRTQRRFATLLDNRAHVLTALNALQYGVIIVERISRVINLNTAAEQLLRAHDGLHMRSGCIGATTAAADRELQCALHDALAGDNSGIRSGRSLTCPRPSAKRPYIIRVIPLLSQDGAGRRITPAKALIVVTDVDREPPCTASILRRLYGFTPCEAEVAVRLTRGFGLKQIAEDMSVSVETVRTHLRHVFDKTDTHRQAALVRLLLAVTP